MSRRRALLLSAAGGSFLTLLVLNLMSGSRRVDRRTQPLYAVGDPQFRRSVGNLLGPPLVGGNAVTELRNGNEIFPSMLEAIRQARRTITLETYIYWEGEVGRAFTDALRERAHAGVRVHVIADWVGSARQGGALLDELRSAGVEVAVYRPPRWGDLGRLNNRTHRKILVADGRVGFTGGAGIGDHWLGHAQSRAHWRESHYRVEGPAVAQMQAAFMDNWMETSGEVLDGEAYFPPLAAAGPAEAQVFRSSPDDGAESVRLMFLLSIAAARRSILLANSYFVPDGATVDALVGARRRGVGVQILVPGPITDAAIVNRASRLDWGPLLEAGVAIHEYLPTMYHCKFMVVDELWVSVGSSNFDSRSFRRDDEANLNVLDAAFARAQAATFEADKAHAPAITLDRWRQRSWRDRMLDRVAGLFRPQL